MDLAVSGGWWRREQEKKFFERQWRVRCKNSISESGALNDNFVFFETVKIKAMHKSTLKNTNIMHMLKGDSKLSSSSFLAIHSYLRMRHLMLTGHSMFRGATC